MAEHSFRFTHAITRKPAPSVVSGLRAEERGEPDYVRMLTHHADYVACLTGTGAKVITLAPLDDFADSVFVEDTALCLPKGAVIMRPGAPTRLGETTEMTPHLAALYGHVETITAPDAFIEAGDILTTEREVLIGLSARTNRQGFTQLAKIIAPWGYRLREVITPKGVLHFKTDCSLLDSETILSTKRLAASDCFAEYRVLHTADGEEAAANAIRFNDLVLFPTGFPKTRDMLLAHGYDVREIGNSECAKIDGGMSCLSLRFSPKAIGF